MPKSLSLFLRNCFVNVKIPPPSYLAKTVTELESMIAEQRQLMEKLTDQCKNLTQNLEDTTSKHK